MHVQPTPPQEKKHVASLPGLLPGVATCVRGAECCSSSHATRLPLPAIGHIGGGQGRHSGHCTGYFHGENIKLAWFVKVEIKHRAPRIL